MGCTLAKPQVGDETEVKPIDGSPRSAKQVSFPPVGALRAKSDSSIAVTSGEYGVIDSQDKDAHVSGALELLILNQKQKQHDTIPTTLAVLCEEEQTQNHTPPSIPTECLLHHPLSHEQQNVNTQQPENSNTNPLEETRAPEPQLCEEMMLVSQDDQSYENAPEGVEIEEGMISNEEMQLVETETPALVAFGVSQLQNCSDSAMMWVLSSIGSQMFSSLERCEVDISHTPYPTDQPAKVEYTTAQQVTQFRSPIPRSRSQSLIQPSPLHLRILTLRKQFPAAGVKRLVRLAQDQSPHIPVRPSDVRDALQWYKPDLASI